MQCGATFMCCLWRDVSRTEICITRIQTHRPSLVRQTSTRNLDRCCLRYFVVLFSLKKKTSRENLLHQPQSDYCFHHLHLNYFVSETTYSVSSGTLNPTILHTTASLFVKQMWYKMHMYHVLYNETKYLGQLRKQRHKSKTKLNCKKFSLQTIQLQ